MKFQLIRPVSSWFWIAVTDDPEKQKELNELGAIYIEDKDGLSVYILEVYQVMFNVSKDGRGIGRKEKFNEPAFEDLKVAIKSSEDGFQVFTDSQNFVKSFKSLGAKITEKRPNGIMFSFGPEQITFRKMVRPEPAIKEMVENYLTNKLVEGNLTVDNCDEAVLLLARKFFS